MTKCVIDGVEFDDVPVLDGEPAFLGDGGPNHDFDWEEWRARLAAEFSSLQVV